MNKAIFKVMKGVRHAVLKNSTVVLTTIGVSGVFTSVALAVKATPKALRVIEAKSEERYGDPHAYSNKEAIKDGWKFYIPTAMAMGFTVTAIIGSTHIGLRKNAALLSLYSVSEQTIRDYNEKLVETIGPKKAQEVKDAVTQKNMDANPVSKNQVVITGKGDVLCYDVTSGRYFKSDRNSIESAVNKLNKQLLNDMWMTLNEFYAEIGLAPTSIGNDLGWNVDNTIDLEFSSMIADDGTPCLVIDHFAKPDTRFRG